jgi:adenine-specific DNA-methyltransferase
MDKLKMQSPNLVEANIAKIAALFPNCITEDRDENGQMRRAVNFDQLRQELSASLVEGPRERYTLSWPGKNEAMLTANAPIAKTLRPCEEESVDFENTKNLYIEGDNLDVLKLLQETYLNTIKVILIDPPFNTGNDFIYEDDFAEDTEIFMKRSNQKDEVGNRMVANTESNGRFHSDWLSMMYPRLKLERNLLRDDGIIFISIDDHEAHNLRKVCDEVFGEQNFFGVFQWRRRQRADSRNQSRVSPDHEYIVAYAKNAQAAKLKGIAIDKTKYQNPDNDSRGPWASIDLTGLANATQRPNLHYDIVDPDTGYTFHPNPNRGWSKSKDNIQKMIDEGRIIFPKSPSGRPREKKFLKDIESMVTGFSTCLDSEKVGYTTNGTREVSEIFGGKIFDFPKPSTLIKLFVEQASIENDIILDIFSGSATTAHATMQLNAEDGGNRKFIMVQLPEPCDEKSEAFKAGYKTIAEIGKERIRRAGKKIKEENATTAPNLDIGFRVFKVDTSNMKEVYYTPDDLKQANLEMFKDHIKPDRRPEDLLFQVFLDWGLDLTKPIIKETIDGKTVFIVDTNDLLACFDPGITEELVKKLAKHKPLRAVFRDDAFGSDSVKINVEQIFKLLSPGTEIKSI